MYAGKPIIGIAGGIGSGKSTSRGSWAEMGCLVIDSDEQVRCGISRSRDRLPAAAVVGGWHSAAGRGSRSGGDCAQNFPNAKERERLESLIHPWVTAARDREMAKAAENPEMVAFVWDTPLLFEKGLAATCDAIIFVESDLVQRRQRVLVDRGWGSEELARRENFQWPLDTKRQISDHVLNNTSDHKDLRDQLQAMLAKIFHKCNRIKGAGAGRTEIVECGVKLVE